MTKKKYLIETSTVPVALDQSSPRHRERYLGAVCDGTVWTSVYVRKEFVRRWIRDYIRMAFVVDHFSDVPRAIYHLEQDFSIRGVKTDFHAIGVMLQQKGGIQNSRAVAKEFGRLAVGELKRYDRCFRKRTSNKCGCRIGGKELKVDYNHFFDDLRDFIASIDDIVGDCPVNSFLDLAGPGQAARLLDAPGVVEKTKAGEKLQDLRVAKKWITCRECQTIGDAVIVLDQPISWCLVHIDVDFNILCPGVGRKHKPLESERAVERDAQRVK